MSTQDADGDIKILEAKVVILGNTGVGKTSIVTKYVNNQFSPLTPATIGASFNIKSVMIGKWKVQTQLWDTAGQERFRSMAPMYYRGAQAAILVFDITIPETLDKVAEWVEELRQHVGGSMVLALAANKADLLDPLPAAAAAQMSEKDRDKYDQACAVGANLFKQATQYAASIGAHLFKTSAKSGTGVEDMFAWLSSRLLDLRLENDKLLEQSRAAPSGSVSADERKSVKLNEDLTAPSAAGCSC